MDRRKDGRSLAVEKTRELKAGDRIQQNEDREPQVVVMTRPDFLTSVCFGKRDVPTSEERKSSTLAESSAILRLCMSLVPLQRDKTRCLSLQHRRLLS